LVAALAPVERPRCCSDCCSSFWPPTSGRAVATAGTSAPVLGWLAAADRLRPRRAIGLAAVLVLANPKILVLTAAAAAAVTVESTSSAQDIAGFATYVVVGSFGVAIPLAARMALGERASRQLESWRTWLIAHGALLTVAILTVLGIALIARGLR